MEHLELILLIICIVAHSVVSAQKKQPLVVLPYYPSLIVDRYQKLVKRGGKCAEECAMEKFIGDDEKLERAIMFHRTYYTLFDAVTSNVNPDIRPKICKVFQEQRECIRSTDACDFNLRNVYFDYMLYAHGKSCPVMIKEGRSDEDLTSVYADG